MFWFLLDQHHGPLSGVYFLDPILGPVSGPPFWGPLSGTPFRSPQWIQKTFFLFCVANIFGSKEAENHIYCADLMVTLKEWMNTSCLQVLHQTFNAASNAMLQERNKILDGEAPCRITGFCGKKWTPILSSVFQAMKWSSLSCRDSTSSLLIKT